MHGRKPIMRAAATLAITGLFLVGCAGMNADARKMLQEPATCSKPQGDIQVLENSRPGGFKRFTQGLQGIAPPMVIGSLLRDIFIGKPYRSIYLDHWRTAFGSYNRKIDERVAELQRCR